MPRKSFPEAQHLRRLIVALVTAAIALLWIDLRHSVPVLAQSQPATYKNFEAPQVHPLTITPDGTRLLAVNTPNNSLSVFHLTGRTLTLMAEIPVGLEPVSVAARNDREVWVTNWLSDSVSVVDLKTWNVTRTFDVGDEPTDVVFAGQQREMAFVCVSGLSQVKIYDPTTPSANPQVMAIRGRQPRALTRDANGSQVFVSVFESGNQTTTVPAAQVAAGGGPPAPNPAMSASLPAAPSVGLIVKWNGSSWSDERSDGRWTPFIPYTLADVDIAVLDASGATVTLNREVHNVGTHIGNAVIDPTSNQLLVLNDEARNNVRFEPNLRGRFINTRISIVGLANSTVTPVDLNQHINFGLPAGSDAERDNSLALPADIARATDGTLYVAATGSAKVGVLDPSGAVQARIAVGQGPTGLALNQKRKLLYVLNRFDESVSVVDTTARAEIATTPVGFNPEPAGISRGRRFLYDARLSAHGDLSCASCHANGHRDGIAWDLGDPQGAMQTVPNPVLGPFGFGPSVFHPMKGPMTTQSLRGILGTEPLHWRGDRAQLSSFNPAFMSLLGGPRQLATDEMADFRAFIQSLTYPPNPNENLDRTLPNPATGPSAARGADLFNSIRFDAGLFTCNQCHTATPGFATGTGGFLIPGFALQESQDFKVPQLRGEYQKTGFTRAAGEQLTGYGFIHDGSTDSLLNFLHAPVFTFQNENQRRDIEQFVLAFDSGIAPAVGLQMTVNADNKTSTAATDRINLLMAQAAAGNCDLIVRGLYNGASRGFLYAGNGVFQTDKQNEAPVSLGTLLQSAGVRSELTFTGVPVGAGRRNAVDQNENGALNGDEPLTPNALDAAAFFVWQHYRDFLSRDPDSGGLDFWTTKITNCGIDTACIHSQRIGVSAQFFIELEFQETGYVVYRMYRGAYGTRSGAPARANITFAQFIADRSLLVGGAGLPQSTINYANTFVSRPEFKLAYADGLADVFVNKLFDTAGLTGPNFAAQRQSAIDGLNSATKTRAQVLLDLIEIQQFKNGEYNPAFVLMQYFGYLRRDPDQGGYDFWLNVLNNRQPNNYRGMVCSFITSTEYQQRFGPSVTRSNQDCKE
jgi:YVTN family beta-propeller protein